MVASFRISAKCNYAAKRFGDHDFAAVRARHHDALRQGHDVLVAQHAHDRMLDGRKRPGIVQGHHVGQARAQHLVAPMQGQAAGGIVAVADRACGVGRDDGVGYRRQHDVAPAAVARAGMDALDGSGEAGQRVHP